MARDSDIVGTSAATIANDAATAAALRKLQSGGTLTNEERVLLGMSIAAQPVETLSSPVGESDPRYYTVKVGNTGKTSAQLAAATNAAETAKLINESYADLGIKSTVDPTTGRVVTTTPTKSVTPTIVTPTIVTPPTQVVTQTTTDPAMLALIQSLQAQISSLTKATTDAAAKAAADKAAADAAAVAQQRKSTIAVLQDRFAKYGLTSLASKIVELAQDGANEATITLQLQETPEYQMRFAANAERVKKGLSVLTPAEYLNVEDGYRQVLRAYGLKQFDTDAYVKQFISNDMSPTELSNRVVTAVQRVQNADPAVLSQLKDYYGIDSSSLVGYVLDPEQQFQKIQRQISAAEIGVAGARQGLQPGAAVAEQLAAQGITQAEAQKGYATIADILPTAEKLSSIYGSTMEGYGQTEGEQEVFNQLASAQRKRQQLSAREIAQFSGTSGVNKSSLMTETKGTF